MKDSQKLRMKQLIENFQLAVESEFNGQVKITGIHIEEYLDF